MKKRRFYSWLLAAAMLFSCAVYPAAAEGETEAQTVYKATDAWYAPENGAAENTYNGQPWKWERKDSGVDWFDFAAYNTAIGAFGMAPTLVIGAENRTAGAAWTTASGGYGHPAVGKGWMMPYLQADKPDNAVCRTFIVPKSGSVTLTTEDGNIYGGSNQPGNSANRTAFIRITRNGTQVWPAEGTAVRIPETNEQIYEFSPVTLTVYKNDELRFEVYNGDSGTQYGKYVWWQPVVTYNEGVVYNSFDALEAEITARAAGETAPESAWSWKTKRAANQFTNFNGVLKAGMNLFVLPENSDGTHNYSYRGVSGTDEIYSFYSTNSTASSTYREYNAMSLWWMRTTNSSSELKAANSVAKVFTAPKTGTVQISAVDADGAAKIYGKKIAGKNQTSGARILIEKTSESGTPTLTADAALYNYKFDYTGFESYEDYAASIDFAPITVDINEGERLWFIVNADDTVAGNSKFVHWNPVVTYLPFSIEAGADDVEITTPDGTLLESYADIAAQSVINVTLNASLISPSALLDGDTRTAVMCAAVFDGENKLVSVGVSEPKTITNASEANLTFAIGNMTISEQPAGGSVKVFLFDAMSTLNPLSEIGNNPIYTAE